MSAAFRRLTDRATGWSGTPAALLLALASVLVWTGAGLAFGFTDTVLLIGNTGMSVVSYLMLFLIQGSQNRDTAALHAKIDELIRALPNADNTLRGIEKGDGCN